MIFGKHIDKCEGDKAKRIYTLPVILGEGLARYCVMGMMIAQYVIAAYLVVTGVFLPVLLIVFFAVPQLRLVYQAYRHPKPAERPQEFPAEVWPLWFVAFAFAHNRRFGLLLLLGMIFDVVIRGVWPLIVK